MSIHNIRTSATTETTATTNPIPLTMPLLLLLLFLSSASRRHRRRSYNRLGQCRIDAHNRLELTTAAAAAGRTHKSQMSAQHQTGIDGMTPRSVDDGRLAAAAVATLTLHGRRFVRLRIVRMTKQGRSIDGAVVATAGRILFECVHVVAGAGAGAGGDC